MKILANDGISQSGIDNLEKNGFEVLTTNVAQEQLIDFINNNKIDALLVRVLQRQEKNLLIRVLAKINWKEALGWIISMLIMQNLRNSCC